MRGRRAQALESWESLFRAQVAVFRRLRDDFRGAEITLGEYDVLYNLTLFDGQRLRLHELNEHIVLTQPSLSRLVERMEKQGLVRRERDPDDRRGTIVIITDYGIEVQRRVGHDHADSIARYMGSGMTVAELRTLRDLCEKLRAAQRDITD